MKSLFYLLAIFVILGMFFPNLLSEFVSILEKLLILLNALLAQLVKTIPQ